MRCDFADRAHEAVATGRHATRDSTNGGIYNGTLHRRYYGSSLDITRPRVLCQVERL
jgi:hypothetical protein